MQNLYLEQLAQIEVNRLMADYRREMMDFAENERLARLARGEYARPAVYRVVMAWAGRQLIAAGRALLMVAENRASSPRMSIEV